MKHFFSILFTVFTSLGLFATVHTVTNSGTTFTPSTLSITQGDTVNWSIAGSHNVIEVDMTTWNANGSTSNGGFSLPFGGGQHIFTSAGTFYYVCGPHAGGGMKATITVAAPPLNQMDLPVNFDMATVDYETIDFGGTTSTFVTDPTGGTNMVVQTIKGAAAATWGGTTLAEYVAPGGPTNDIGFATAIPMSLGNTTMSVKVYSPDAGIPVRLKIEDSQDATKSVETQTMTTVANAWETLIFDFSNEATGTAAINFTYTFDKASIFFNFGTDGATAGAKTYYWDDVEFGGTVAPPTLAQMDLPVTFDDTANVNYATIDFGGNASSFVLDPAGGTNLVVQSIKDATAQLWAGTTLSEAGPLGLASAIPFSATETSMSVRVYSPDAGIPVRLKVEDKTNNTITCETETMTTGVNTWETLVFDFSNEVTGTAALNIANTFDLASIFFNFGTDGATAGVKTYYWDDVEFVSSAPPVSAQMDLPVTFDDTANVNYATIDFGGNASSFVVDPAGGTNLVVQSIKDATAQLWAGTTLSEAGPLGLASAIPFSATETSMSVRVYSPDAGIPVRLKVEDKTNNTITCETETMTTGVNTWETLVFDFSNEVTGTAALNIANTFDLASIFFNFGTDGATAGVKTYYWDDVEFVSSAPPVSAQMDLPVTFDDTANVNYATIDFGGNASSFVVDPAGGTNLVVQSIKDATAQLWAGTTLSEAGPLGLASAIPFSATETSMSVRVYSPDAGIPVRLKVEDKTNNTITCETETMTTGVNTWETLVFDFSNEVTGTAALNISNTFDLASIFFNFGTDGATAGVKTYYWDDVEFVSSAPPVSAQMDLPVTFDDTANVNYATIDFGGNASSFVVDPAGGTNLVVQSIKDATAQTWAGTTLAEYVAPGGAPNDIGFLNAIPFAVGATTMSVRVYSPDAGVPVRLKVENELDPTQSVETEATTTVANTWETLVFDFANEATGTAALNYAFNFDKASVFFNFGTDGATAGVKTYYWDDVEFGGAAPAPDSVNITYLVNTENIVVDATGIFIAGGANFGVPGDNPLTDANNDGVWETTLRMASGNLGNYIFLNGNSGWGAKEDMAGLPCADAANFNDRIMPAVYNDTTIMTCYETCSTDTSCSVVVVPTLAQMDLPVTFDDTATVNYATIDFGGNNSSFVVDPAGGTNLVVQSIKDGTAQLWAGTTLDAGTPKGFLNAIPFTATATTMSVRVYSPDAGIPIRLKVEDKNNNTITCETETMTTLANTWETLVFDFSDEVSGTAALDIANTYDLASIFFNFGTDGATAGAKTYFWDDVAFGGTSTGPCSGVTPDPLILDDFECQGNINYTFANATWTPNIANPDQSGINTSSMVGEFIHWGAATDGAFGGGLNLGPINISTDNLLKVDVWTNANALPITIVLQDGSTMPVDILSQTATTSATAMWETLEFDMSAASSSTDISNIVFVVNPGSNDQDTVYIDNIRFDGAGVDPCAGVVADKDIMEDFDCQRNLNYVFVEGGFVTIPNPDVSGINTSANIGQYTRNNTEADAFGGDFTLAPLDFSTNNQIKMNVWDANAPSTVTIVLQNASGTDLGEATASSTTANTWEDLNFDFSTIPDAAGVSKVVLLFDAGLAADSGQVYFFDNLRMEGFVTGISEINSTDISIYPNPSGDFLNVNLSALGSNESVTFTIFSIDGKVVKEIVSNTTSNIVQLDLTEVTSGFYLLEVATGSKKHLTKFIKD